VLGELFGYKVIPNGVFLDEAGVVRFAKTVFSVANEADVAAITALLSSRGQAPAVERAQAAVMGSAVAGGGSPDAGLQRGLNLLEQGDRAGAVGAWRDALRTDPDNFVIRKQIWAVEHPERFYPAIDAAWQKEQLAQERG
jgi:hypothetical protein